MKKSHVMYLLLVLPVECAEGGTRCPAPNFLLKPAYPVSQKFVSKLY